MKWRINFSIINSNYNMVAYCPHVFIKNIPRKNGQQLFKEWYYEYENGRTTAYIPVSVIEEMTNWIKDKIITEPEWADELHTEAEKLNRQYFAYAKELANCDFSALLNEKLFFFYETLKDWQIKSHAHAVSTTWFVDSDKEVFSNYLRERFNNHLGVLGINDRGKQVEYFTILTTPTRESLAQQEEIEFLELLKIFESGKININDVSVVNYYEKWRWTPYGYIGPAYTLKYYQDKLKANIGKIDIEQILLEEKNRNHKIQIEQDLLQDEIKLPDDLRHLFKIARDIIWLKDFRKYCIWHGHYVLDMLTKEIARRLNIGHKQANYFLTKEVKEALDSGFVDENLLNNRIRYSVFWADENGCKLYYGEEARAKIKNLDVENLEVNLSDGLRGSCAYPGLITGRVKIVNSADEIDKISNGDIMLALTTYPALLPAMKRAGAIITEDGGITCHAAIVAREFRIPCVVGVKKVTSILHDGDEVEVNATEGIVSKMKI